MGQLNIYECVTSWLLNLFIFDHRLINCLEHDFSMEKKLLTINIIIALIANRIDFITSMNFV